MRNIHDAHRGIGGPGPGPGPGGGWTVQAQDMSRVPGPLLRHRCGHRRRRVLGSGPQPVGLDFAATGPASISGTRGGLDALRSGRRTGAVTFGPGVDVSFPNDPYLMPFLLPEEVGQPDRQGKVPTHVTSDLLENARRIADPAERSLALRQIANGAIASNQLVLAHHTLEESITASSHVNVPLVRDQRLIGLVTSLTALTDALLRIARENPDRDGGRPRRPKAAGLDPLPKRPEATVMIRLARLEWRRAVYLAEIIGNPTYRNEMLYRVAESEALGSGSIAKDFGQIDIESLGNPTAELPRAAHAGVPAATADRRAPETGHNAPSGHRAPTLGSEGEGRVRQAGR